MRWLHYRKLTVPVTSFRDGDADDRRASGASSCSTRPRRSSSTDGFHAVSIEAVARAAGITRPIVYGHFDDLGGLLEALVERESRRALCTQLPGRPSTTCSAALTAYLEAVRERPGHLAARADAAGGRAAAAARADRGRPRRGGRAARAGAGRARTCPTPSSPPTCCRPTPTRPRGWCSQDYDVERILELTRWALARLRVILADLSLLRRRRDLRLLDLRLHGLAARRRVHAGRARRAGLRPHRLDAGGRPAGRGRVRPDRRCWRSIGGALADAFDRRKLIWGAELARVARVRRAARQRAAARPAAVGALRRGGAVRRRLGASCARRWTRCCRGWSSATSSRRRARSTGRWLSVATIAGPALAGVLIAATDVSRAYGLDLVDASSPR